MTAPGIEQWTRWIDGTIKNNVLKMHLHRDAWSEVAEILQTNGNLPDSYWWEFMVDTYLTTQAMAVRRQADRRRNISSLAKLIQQIRDRPSQITREFWIGLWSDPGDPFLMMEAERGWNEQYAGTVGRHLDRAIPAADLETLVSASGKVKEFVDAHIAHSGGPLRTATPSKRAEAESVPPNVTLSVKEVHDVIDVIGDLFKKYYNLLTASSFAMLVPVIQDDWKAIFREPWIRPGSDSQ